MLSFHKTSADSFPCWFSKSNLRKKRLFLRFLISHLSFIMFMETDSGNPLQKPTLSWTQEVPVSINTNRKTRVKKLKIINLNNWINTKSCENRLHDMLAKTCAVRVTDFTDATIDFYYTHLNVVNFCGGFKIVHMYMRNSRKNAHYLLQVPSFFSIICTLFTEPKKSEITK